MLKPLIDRFNATCRGSITRFVMIEKGDDLKQSLNQFVSALVSEIGPKATIGSIQKEMQQGKYISALGEVMSEKMPDAKLVDLTDAITDTVSIRLPEDMDYFAKCSKFLCRIYKDYIDQVEQKAERDEEITQGQMSRHLNVLFEEKVSKYALEQGIVGDSISQVFNPCIQSGGVYTMSLSFKNDNSVMQYDAIVMSAMISYYDYNCLVSRTLLFGTEKAEENDYKLM